MLLIIITTIITIINIIIITIIYTIYSYLNDNSSLITNYINVILKDTVSK